MESKWSYFLNPFLNITRSSFRKMKQVGDYTLAALNAYVAANSNTLSADKLAAFKTIISLLQPLVADYDDLYIHWLYSQGTRKGQTLSLTQLLKLLSKPTIQDWDIAIMNVYKPGTPEYMKLLPNRRSPYQSGSQQDKITAVGALSLAIGNDPQLQDLKKAVDDMHDNLVKAINTQKGSISNTGGNSDALESSRVSLGTALYGALGMLMYLYMDNPDAASIFFPMEILRNREQTVFTHHVNGGETMLVFTRTLAADELLKITVDGNTALQFALVAEKNDAMPADAFTVAAKESETVEHTVLGAAGNRYCIVKNLSATEKGAFTVEIL